MIFHSSLRHFYLDSYYILYNKILKYVFFLYHYKLGSIVSKPLRNFMKSQQELHC